MTPSYIGGPGNQFCRKVFNVRKHLKSATVWITADPHSYLWKDWMRVEYEHNWLMAGSFLKYRLFVNSTQVGAGPARPIVDAHAVEHRFDVTAALVEGRNVIGVISRGERYGFALRLELEYRDGKTRRLVTGADWKTFPANDVFAPYCWFHPGLGGFQKGSSGPGETPEHLDGELYPFGWLRAGFNDRKWKKAKIFAPGDAYEIEPATIPNYRFTRVAPQEIRRLDVRRILVDFGRNVTGAPELRTSREGVVEMRLGEELLPSGEVRFQMRTGNCYQEGWRFPAGGATLTNFGVRSFRYLELVDYPGELRSGDVAAIALNSPFNEKDSTLELSDHRLEKVWNFCRDTIRYTTWDVYYDCPSRERMAYEADAYINMLTHFCVEHRSRVARRTFEYQINHTTWPCEWRMFLIPVMREYLLHTGDMGLLEQYYPRLVKECSFHELLCDGLVSEFPMRIIVDWPMSCRDNYEFGSGNAVANAFVYWDLTLLAELADYLGRDRDARKFSELAAELRAAFNARLYDGERGLFLDHVGSTHASFHANMFALAFGVAEENHVGRALDFIDRSGMKCSVYGAQFYLDALFRHRRAERAIELMTSDGERSWLRMISGGATVTTEAWDVELKPNMSFAHPWGSAPGNVIVRRLFGIRPTRPGWAEYEFDPQPGPVKRGSFQLRIPEGRIHAHFKRNADGSLTKHLDFVRDK